MRDWSGHGGGASVPRVRRSFDILRLNGELKNKIVINHNVVLILNDFLRLYPPICPPIGCDIDQKRARGKLRSVIRRILSDSTSTESRVQNVVVVSQYQRLPQCDIPSL